MRKRNLDIDFIQIFDNITNSEFFKGVHYNLDLGKVSLAQIAPLNLVIQIATIL